MKLGPKLVQCLIDSIETKSDESIAGVIDDACEMLTLKVVVFLKGRQKEIAERRKGLPLGDPEANVLVAQMRALGEAIVALAES